MSEGRRRVVIDELLPSLDRGRFAIKRIVGDQLAVEAHAFPDGHDEISVLLRHRPPGASEWIEQPMSGPDNDRWSGSLVLDVIGRHEYSVAAWIDHFSSWRRDLEIRQREGVVTTVDVLIGADLVEAAAVRCAGHDRDRLDGLGATLRTEETAQAVAIALGDELGELMQRCPDRRFESTWAPALAVVVDPARARFGAWYELFPRSTSPIAGQHGTFRDVIDRLDYVADLGFDVLYLPPIHPIGSAFRKGANNSFEVGPDDPGVPWAIGSAAGGHTATHPRLGSLEDFDALVSSARARDIDIALDLAFQASPDHPWVEQHRDWFKSRPDGTIQYAENPPKKYQDAYPLDFETDDWQSLWHELLSVVRFWMDHGVRIFRVDNPHTKPFDFWEWLIGDIKASDPDVIFLAEAFTGPRTMYRLAKLGFSQSYTYFTWRNGKQELQSYLEEITRPPIADFFRANLFTNTPDILHAYLQQGGRAAFEVRFVLAATLGASYGIYGPPFELTEATPLKPGSEEYLDSEKYQLRHWDVAPADGIAPLIRQVNAIRRAHPPLQCDDGLRFHHSDDDALLAYTKRDARSGDVVLMVVNLDNSNSRGGRISLPLEELGLGDDGYLVHDLLGGHSG
ncbi:MAG: alpha-1,4-glucan--maltose-1-phosphate maltosyltransferase, partial [Chloroflexota bacterium]